MANRRGARRTNLYSLTYQCVTAIFRRPLTPVNAQVRCIAYNCAVDGPSKVQNAAKVVMCTAFQAIVGVLLLLSGSMRRAVAGKRRGEPGGSHPRRLNQPSAPLACIRGQTQSILDGTGRQTRFRRRAKVKA